MEPEPYLSKNGSPKDAILDAKIQDCVQLRYLDMSLSQRACIDREAQLVHDAIKELKTTATAIEIIWAIGRKMNEAKR